MLAADEALRNMGRSLAPSKLGDKAGQGDRAKAIAAVETMVCDGASRRAVRELVRRAPPCRSNMKRGMIVNRMQAALHWDWWPLRCPPAIARSRQAMQLRQHPGPVAAELPAPPPAHTTSLAAAAPADAAAAEAALVDQVARLGKLAPEAESALVEASFDGGASSSLVVLAGGRQADVARPPRARHERWEIRFASGTSVEAYARQLDFFKIELGVIGGQQQVTYLTNLSNPKPTTRTGDASEDRRLYLIWQRGAIREVDEHIAARAGVKTEGKVIAHFLPQGGRG